MFGLNVPYCRNRVGRGICRSINHGAREIQKDWCTCYDICRAFETEDLIIDDETVLVADKGVIGGQDPKTKASPF